MLTDFTLPIYDDKSFEGEILTEQLFSTLEFHGCIFKKCSFSNSSFKHNKFIDCIFEDCELSLMKLDGSTLSNVIFKHSKMLGIDFGVCQNMLFTVQFEHCMLDYCSFAGKKMPKTAFVKCSLKEASFAQANLLASVFSECDLLRTVFDRTDLTSVNFASAYNYNIDPEINKLTKASFSEHGLAGLLTKYNIKII